MDMASGIAYVSVCGSSCVKTNLSVNAGLIVVIALRLFELKGYKKEPLSAKTVELLGRRYPLE